MADKNSLLESLPGSNRVSGAESVVSNYTLMPIPSKHPGMPPPDSSKYIAPPPHLLGSGSKIPESYESRMRSQFSTPDPAIYSQRKYNNQYVAGQEGGGLAGEVRFSMPCNAYKSNAGGSSSGSSDGRVSFADRNSAELALKKVVSENARTREETKRLMGQKEAMLSGLCSNPNVTYGSPEISRVVNIVMDINKKLGLPPANMGQWKLPS